MTQMQTVVLAIDARNVGLTRIKVLNFNLASAASTPINPAPLRPSLSTSAVSALNAIGPERAALWDRVEQDRKAYPMTLWDWEKIEIVLTADLAGLRKAA